MSFNPIPLFNDNDVVDRDRLNDIVGNLNEINEAGRLNTQYNTPELVSTRNFKIAAGRLDISPGKASETIVVDLEGFFESTTAKPVVSATLATSSRKRSFVSVSDVTSNSFRITVETASGEIFTTGNSVHWTAMGF
jgi:hypothetical protein